MEFEKPKIVVVLREGLLAWQELNVTAFLAGGLAARHPALIGEEYADGDGQPYLPIFAHPVSVLVADAATLAGVRTRAVGRGLPVSVYVEEMFATSDDASNRATVSGVPGEALPLVGLALAGERNVVDRVAKGARLHA